MNRLSRERSPYLLQHAGNPVDWYPWGEEAFAKARAEDRPIFLSVGYSTCHWCHVMEHESFENPAVAAALNGNFVSIKVDREERPDVDRVYMTFVQRTTGSGGWPMSVWLTPDLKPFYGGTYFPPESKWGRPGFIDIVREIARVWQGDRAKVLQSAEAVIEQLRAAERAAPASGMPGAGALANTVHQFRHAFDREHGGFGDAPKFPRPSELFFLLREHARTGDVDARDMTLRTLTAMALGGMRDHIGGGFHRYAVDAAWRVPHFEKMLYDQAQLALAFLEGAQVSGNPFFIEVAEDTLRYVMREMTAEEGGFYSAEDADSEEPAAAHEPGAETSKPHKAEGAFYLWTAAEIQALLGEDAPIVTRRFGIAPDGNAPFDPQGEFAGKNLLYIAAPIDDLAGEFHLTSADVSAALSRARLAMFHARLARPRPHLDDKVLTAWNGLMIAALARAARMIDGLAGDEGESAGTYLNAARRAAGFIQGRMWDAGTRTLRRRFRDDHAAIDAYAEDYACLICGLLELFQADPEPRWLEWAVELQRRQDELFWDEAEGGWFSTTGADASVLLRMKEEYDGAEPSASSVSVMNLIALSHLADLPTANERIEKTFTLFGGRLEQLGRSVPMMAAALSAHVAGASQLVIVGDDGARELVRVASMMYLPFTLSMRLNRAAQAALAPALPAIAAMRGIDGGPAAYVCRDFACRAPVSRADDLERELRA